MELLTDWFSRAKLGPLPLPYILAVALFPVWTLIRSSDNALLYFVFVIITILLKGSLMSCWVFHKFSRDLPSSAPQQRPVWQRRRPDFSLLRSSMESSDGRDHTAFLEGLILVSGVILAEMCIINEELRISILFLVVLVPLSTISGIGIFLLHSGGRGDGMRAPQVIGIFSRSSGDDYNWLMSELRTSGRLIPFYITNSNGSEFRATVSQCTQAILYHSKTRGRLNITNVTDSLYDEEVRYMSHVLGPGKVWVVVDDLEDGSERAKNDILTHQRTIRDLTHDLYLFTREEKCDKERIRQKLQPFLKTLSRGSSGLRISDIVGLIVLCVPWLHYVLHAYHGVILVLSNIGGMVLLSHFLLPFSLGSRQAGPLTLLLVVGLELFAVFWYSADSGAIVIILLVTQSLCTLVYAVLTSSSAAP